MSLNTTPPLVKIPEIPPQQTSEQEGSALTDSNHKKSNDCSDSQSQARSSNDSKFDQQPSQQKKAKTPTLKPQPVRQKLMQRHRSVSSPVIHRPIPSSTQAQVKPPEISSLPKLTDKSPKAKTKVLTLQQQLASDLADLMEKVLLRKKGRLDDLVDLNQATINLQRQFPKNDDGKILLESLMYQLFSGDLKKTEAWTIARDIIDKIRINYFQVLDASGFIAPEKQKEVAGMLSILASGFAGAFFNISGSESKNRLPESLQFFLAEIDYRQIRMLLSDDKGIAMSQDNFLRLRKEWLAKVLIDAFLVPLVQKEFFPIRGTLAADQVVSQIISALDGAFAISSPALLSQSLKSAPEDVQNLVKKRRTTNFQPRVNRLESSPEKAPQTQNTQQIYKNKQSPQPLLSTPRSMLSVTPSPSRQRRIELQQMLKKLATLLAVENQKIPKEILAKIKTFNNEFATSKNLISELTLYQSWLGILKESDAESALVDTLERMMKEVAEAENEQLVLDNELLEIELLSKLTAIEVSGEKLSIERATRLSSHLPLNPKGRATLPSDLPLPLPSLSPVGSPTKFKVSSSSTTTSPKSPASPASPISPASPASSITHKPSQHRRMRRMKTADVTPVRFGDQPKGLTEQERNALITAYPDLLISTNQPLIFRKTDKGLVLRRDPVKEIITAGRDKFSIPLESVPKALREKIKSLKSLPDDAVSISHAELLKLLFVQEFRSSEAGEIISNGRQQALRSAGSSPTADVSSNQPALKAEKNRLTALFGPHAQKITMSLLGGKLSQSGFPPALIKLWKQFDQKLVDWAKKDLRLSDEDLDKMRSALGFDLIVTRLIYPVCIGAEGTQPSLPETSFADAVRQSTLTSWDAFFQQFKQS